MKTLTIFLSLVTASLAADLNWPQYGGPHRNFMVDSTGLADKWPAAGPRKLWSRALGEGYSEISADGGQLFTMVRRGSQEVVISLDAATGKTLWEHPYNSPENGMALENGPGPHTTPLIVGDRVYTTGINALLNCLDKKTGKLVWSKDLYKEFPGATQMDRGYSTSPL
ncbi:MAG TPA: PQQ-binding-like beta-propeller repeat protein, partial [Bryobacteraceae bacterium]|nr:PQQ-binding-like beta-propeller repeat protein [Bryobacteraceae bacterium]